MKRSLKITSSFPARAQIVPALAAKPVGNKTAVGCRSNRARLSSSATCQLDRPLTSALAVAPFAVAAADVVVGPAPGGALVLRVLATLAALALTMVVIRRRPVPFAAEACAMVALLCAGLAR